MFPDCFPSLQEYWVVQRTSRVVDSIEVRSVAKQRTSRVGQDSVVEQGIAVVPSLVLVLTKNKGCFAKCLKDCQIVAYYYVQLSLFIDGR